MCPMQMCIDFLGDTAIVLMDKDPANHLGYIKPCKKWDKPPS